MMIAKMDIKIAGSNIQRFGFFKSALLSFLRSLIVYGNNIILN